MSVDCKLVVVIMVSVLFQVVDILNHLLEQKTTRSSYVKLTLNSSMIYKIMVNKIQFCILSYSTRII